ncbi:MAG: SusD/RagB family nutrient-binding outer membrane lipoprotein, partial [Bacteroidetes bacterium]|nr:SusD/RagB family nutrient-binding outer membrane lipoprotein [Bacteroidota bacterium]
MKKIFGFYLLPALMLLTVSSCQKNFDNFTKNGNVATAVPASLLFNGVLNSMVDFPDGADEIWCQYYIYNYNYYGNNTYAFGSGDNYYNTLKNVVSMEQQATLAGQPALNPY